MELKRQLRKALSQKVAQSRGINSSAHRLVCSEEKLSKKGQEYE